MIGTMRVIAVLNQKGGVGKTTTAVNLGVALARQGLSVLLADLDPQAHLTRSLGLEPEAGGPGLAGVLRGELPLADVLVEVEGLRLAPGSLELSGADGRPGPGGRRERLVAEALSGLSVVDLAILDCPPNLGLLTVNALAAAQGALIPVQAEYLALASLAGVMDTLAAARAVNPVLRPLGIALTRYSHRKRLCREVAAAIRNHFPELLFETRIREGVALAEAPGFGRSIFAYAPRSAGALDYGNLARELAGRLAP